MSKCQALRPIILFWIPRWYCTRKLFVFFHMIFDEMIFHCSESNVTCKSHRTYKTHLISWENVTFVTQLICISNSLNSCIFPPLERRDIHVYPFTKQMFGISFEVCIYYVWHMNPNEMWTSWVKHIIKPEWNSKGIRINIDRRELTVFGNIEWHCASGLASLFYRSAIVHVNWTRYFDIILVKRTSICPQNVFNATEMTQLTVYDEGC